MPADDDYQRCAGQRGACGSDGMLKQRSPTVPYELLRMAKALRAAGGEQDARGILSISCCEACHVATILKP
jgi:hypothetical protein